MRLPTQATPVRRGISISPVTGTVAASGLACALCDLLPEPARSICKAAAC